MENERPTHERRGSRRKSEEWGRTTTSDGLDGAEVAGGGALERRRTMFARDEREGDQWGGVQVEDREDGIRIWECSALKNQGESVGDERKEKSTRR